MPTQKFLNLYAILGRQKKRLIKKKHTVRAEQDFPSLAVLVLEYQYNTGSQNLVLEYQI